MNLPNKLTVARVLMIPLFLVFYFCGHTPLNYFLALAVFVLASLTDMLDGKIARKRGLITDFGKLMDPLADKLLVTSALCCILPDHGVFGIISLVMILSREFIVTSIRLIAAGKGEVLAADIWGKVKTAAQMVWICLKLAEQMTYEAWLRVLVSSTMEDFTLSNIVGFIYQTLATINFAMLILVVLLTVASGAHYVWKNRRLFADA